MEEQATPPAEGQPGVFMGAAAKQAQEGNNAQPESALNVSRDKVPSDIIIISIAKNMKTGAVQVSGPIDNKYICYGMLGEARDAIQQFADQLAAKANQSEIKPL